MSLNIIESETVVDLQDILIAIKFGRYNLTRHARLRMEERKLTFKDIRRCGNTGKASLTEDGKIRITGTGCDNEILTLICIYDGGVLVITMF